MNFLVNEILEYSYNNQIAHIPSALSMKDYIYILFNSKFITSNDFILLGKSFGAQTFYLIWKQLGYLNSIDNLNSVLDDTVIDFVDYSEDFLGNCLGIASGIAIANSTKKVWVNLSDAMLQMGNILEAIQFIGNKKLKNIIVTVDYNNCQVTDSVNNIISVDSVVTFFQSNLWNVIVSDGHNHVDIKESLNKINNNLPNVIIYKTTKGKGVIDMEEHPNYWHFKKIDEKHFRQFTMSV